MGSIDNEIHQTDGSDTRDWFFFTVLSFKTPPITTTTKND